MVNYNYTGHAWLVSEFGLPWPVEVTLTDTVFTIPRSSCDHRCV